MPQTPNKPQDTGARKGAFLPAVLVLVSGTALAHGITALGMPILSRLYSPAEFGMLAVFSGLLAIISVAACLRYELAIALPKSDDDALNLLALSMLCCFALSALLAGIVFMAPDDLISLVRQPGLRPYLWLAPLGLLLAGTYSALQFWHVRRKLFSLLARTRVAQSLGGTAVQIGMGWSGTGPLGLLIGYVMNTGIACLGLGGALRHARAKLSWHRMRALAVEYRRFPIYSTFEALANSAAMQVPMIMIAAIAAPSEAGHLMLAMYVAQAPMSLIGTAIGQVYLSSAPSEHRDGNLGHFTLEILSKLLKGGLGPLLALGIVSPVVFGLIFGPGWERAGWLVSWMMPSFLLQFLTVPIAMALHVVGRQGIALSLQLVGLALRVGTVWLTGLWSPDLAAESFAISGAIFYFAYLSVIASSTGMSFQHIFSAIRSSCPTTIAWLFSALTLLAVVHLFGLSSLASLATLTPSRVETP